MTDDAHPDERRRLAWYQLSVPAVYPDDAVGLSVMGHGDFEMSPTTARILADRLLTVADDIERVEEE